MAQSLQSEDEENRGDQISEFKEVIRRLRKVLNCLG